MMFEGVGSAFVTFDALTAEVRGTRVRERGKAKEK